MGARADRGALKVLHIDQEIRWAGGEAQVAGLIQHLSSRGHQNHLMCHPEGRLFAEARSLGVKVFPLKMRNDLDLRPVFSLRHLVRRERYDIVHFHTRRAHSLSLWLGRSWPGLRTVVTRRMDYPIRKKWFGRWLYNHKVDGVVAISRKIAAVLMEAGVRESRIRIIYSGVDPARFDGRRSTEKPHCPVTIGTVALLEERKGHRFLLEAAALLKQRGHRLRYCFAGEGLQRGRLEALARERGLEGEVGFMGFVADIPDFLSRIDIFVLPSLYEGLGVAVLEAMAAAKPVVASRVGGLPELVADEETGLLVPPGDAAALADSIARLVPEQTVMDAMGERGRERVEQLFTLERMAARNEEFYYDLLGQ